MTFLRKLYRRLFGYLCDCGKRCQTQRGLTRHQRTMHEPKILIPKEASNG